MNMRKIFLSFVAVPDNHPHPVPKSDKTNQKDHSKNIKQELKRYQIINGIPGLVCQISKDQELIFSKTMGYSNVETLQKMKENSVFRIGSISKLFAAVTMDRLCKIGLIDENSPIEKYLSWLSNDDSISKVSVVDILRHESGCRHYIEKEFESSETHLNKRFDSAKSAIEALKLSDQINTPGKFKYSTHAFTFLAAIVEAQSQNDPIMHFTSNKSYAHYLKTTLFEPLEMFHTFPDQTEHIVPNRANVYEREKNVLRNPPQIDQSWKYAGGGMLSSAPDLIKFGNWVLKNFHEKNHPWLEKNSDHKWLIGFDPQSGGHTGASIGGSCILAINKEKRLVIVILTNQTSSHTGLLRLVKILESHF